jgi:L-iditol 2-dehydrogenase
MSLDMGALLEPLGVAIQAVRRAQMQPGGQVLVFGAGTVGLLTAAVAKRAGAATVVITDIDEGRVSFATSNGFADLGHTTSSKRSGSTEESITTAKETAAALGELTSTKDYDVVFECTGVASPLQAAIFVRAAPSQE